MNKNEMVYGDGKAPGIFSQFPKILTLAYYSLRAQLRNPATFAFGFIFPIVFISVFGLVGTSNLSIKLGVPSNVSANNPLVKTLEKIEGVKVNQGNEGDLRNEVAKGKLDGLILIQEKPVVATSVPSYNVTMEISQANPQTSGVAVSIVNGVVDRINLSVVKNPAIQFSTKKVSGTELRYIDFALPGMIGFALLSTAIFGTAFGFIFLKKTLVLKRIFATPTKPSSIILGQGLARLMTAILQTILILAFGVIVFKFHLAHGWITFGELLLLSGLGLVVFLGFGLFISGISNDENAVAPLANLITLPQFLFSGTFFATDVFPTWVQPIANNLPLSYLNAAVRKVSTEGAGLNDISMYLLGLVVWGIVAYFLASRTFKWQ